jgi:hypothetical protein
VASLTKGVPNLGPRLSVVSAKGGTLAQLGTEPIGEGLGEFIAPHGIALDSRGDIYVAEVANTYWPVLFGAKPDHELRSLHPGRPPKLSSTHPGYLGKNVLRLGEIVARIEQAINRRAVARPLLHNPHKARRALLRPTNPVGARACDGESQSDPWAMLEYRFK